MISPESLHDKLFLQAKPTILETTTHLQHLHCLFALPVLRLEIVAFARIYPAGHGLAQPRERVLRVLRNAPESHVVSDVRDPEDRGCFYGVTEGVDEEPADLEGSAGTGTFAHTPTGHQL